MPSFCWLIFHQAWSVPRPTPQLIADEESFDWNQLQLHNKGKVTVLARHRLTEEENMLTLDELARRYPL